MFSLHDDQVQVYRRRCHQAEHHEQAEVHYHGQSGAQAVVLGAEHVLVSSLHHQQNQHGVEDECQR